MPAFAPGEDDNVFLLALATALRDGACDAAALDALFRRTGFPRSWKRLILVLYAPGHKRILASRETQPEAASFAAVFAALLGHPRRSALAQAAFRLQMDFITETAQPVELGRIGVEQSGALHFEPGVDGLLFKTESDEILLFLPGDAFVRSIMGMRQLREYLYRAHGEEVVRHSRCWRFRSQSYVSNASAKGWLRLYRGYPLVGALTKDKLEKALTLAIDHIQLTQKADGRFLYYYDAALDSRRDHEHPTRDPFKNPYYNILRHGGGGLTCIYYEKHFRSQVTHDNIRRAIDYLLAQARIQDYDGKPGAYIFHEKKAKLGGSGIALYLLTDYQMLTGDNRYREWADKFAWHLVNQITASGEFIYYNIYLNKPVTEAQNHQYFSFYYPGEAVCGLAKYLHIADAAMADIICAKLRKALHFLLVERPALRAEHYTAVPSDSWLMMGIMELWDQASMRDPAYAEFVFADAAKMIDHLYKVSDAPHPDYAGAFYYQFGDYPYADGARCEGLCGAYELAVKMGDQDKARVIWQAMKLAAWSVLHLTNTDDSVYSAIKPALARGGIRFKYTRQWFRIDTIQHVASFFAKMLPHWEEGQASISENRP